VVLITAGWLPLPFLVEGTDLVAAVPERLARRIGAAAGVTIIEPPFGIIELIEAAWWHPLYATDPALTWLRAIVTEIAASLPPVLSLPVSVGRATPPDGSGRGRRAPARCSHGGGDGSADSVWMTG